MKNKDLNLASIKLMLAGLLGGLKRYAAIICFVVVAAAYGFLVYRINALNGIQPSDSDVSAQAAKSTAIPHIDPNVVKQLEDLKDNSVNVKTLFEQARNNPFSE